MGHRDRILHLLEIYEMLLQDRQTFNSLRQQTRLGYHQLRDLLDKLLENEFVYIQAIDSITYYQATLKLVELFQGKFYDGVREFKGL